MIYRFTAPGTIAWAEARFNLDTNQVEARYHSNPDNWIPITSYRTMEEMETEYIQAGWSMVKLHDYAATPAPIKNDFKYAAAEKHKCRCEWRDVYMKGCTCGGC